MKKTRLAALILAVVMIVCAFAGCGKEAVAAITFRDTVITENEFIYWMSTYKGIFLKTLGSTTDNPAFWSAQMAEGVTYGDYFDALAQSSIMSNAVALQLFGEYGLTLTKEEINSVDTAINSLITSVGGRSTLNSYLVAYGINIDILRDIKLDTLKAAKLQNHLYGENGIYAATEEELDAYYKENYYRAKYIVISKDMDYILDEKGERILDTETGSYLTRDLTEAEVEEKKELAKDLELRITSGEDFETLMKEYTMDTRLLGFEDGYYFTSSATFVENAVKQAVATMAFDEVKAIETELGWYIIKRYELREDAWKDEAYAPYMFTDLAASVNTVKMQEAFGGFSDEIITNDMVIDSYTIANCTANFYY